MIVDRVFELMDNIPPKTQWTREALYSRLTSIIKGSDEIVEFSRSPILLFDARPYHEKKSNKIPYEKAMIDALEGFIKKLQNTGAFKYKLLISSQDTIKEAKENNFIERVLGKILLYCDFQRIYTNFQLLAAPLNDDHGIILCAGWGRLWLG